VVIPVDFDRQMARPGADAPIQLITDGSEPNTANFAQGYVEGIWQIWQQQRAEDRGETFEPLIDVQMRYWFNPAAISQHFIIPGAVTIIMTVVGAILTSLVVAREWERGTMEALLSTESPAPSCCCASSFPTISSACWRCCCVCWCRYLFSACRIAARW
jgi:ABC-2 type transport system permease protein